MLTVVERTFPIEQASPHCWRHEHNPSKNEGSTSIGFNSPRSFIRLLPFLQWHLLMLDNADHAVR
jgi:hypothetical protein